MSFPSPFKREWKSAPPPEPKFRLFEFKTDNATIQTGIATENSPYHKNHTEDSKYVSNRGIFCVLDGVGGGVRGDLASQKAAQELTMERLAGRDLMTRLVMEAKPDEPMASVEDVEAAMRQTLANMQEAVIKLQTDPEILVFALEKAQKKSLRKLDPSNPYDRRTILREARTMSCTASLSKIWRDVEGKDHRTIAHVGDSRIYRLREGKLERMTEDHSIVQTVVDLKLPDDKGIPIEDDHDITRSITLAEVEKQISIHPELTSLLGVLRRKEKDRLTIDEIRHFVNQTIGSPHITPMIRTDEIKDGDIELICSDGLSDVLTDEEIKDILIKLADDPLKAAQELERQATERSVADVHVRAKGDDITVLVTRYKKEKTP